MMTREEIVARATRPYTDAELDLLATQIAKLTIAREKAKALSRSFPKQVVAIAFDEKTGDYTVDFRQCIWTGEASIVERFVGASK